MKQSEWNILSNLKIAERTYRMLLSGDTEGIEPGQFVEVELPGLFLRRPISVSDSDGDILTLIYKVVGQGTELMAKMKAGGKLNLLTHLGKGYDLEKTGERVLLIGGGVGVPPLMYAAKRLVEKGKMVRVVMGFNTQNEVFGQTELEALGCQVEVCTMDGSYGKKGVVTDWLSCSEPEYLACGPLPMLQAVVEKIGVSGQVSMEERMGCGVGICVGCSIETKEGVKRVCKEGPVFEASEIVWK